MRHLVKMTNFLEGFTANLNKNLPNILEGFFFGSFTTNLNKFKTFRNDKLNQNFRKFTTNMGRVAQGCGAPRDTLLNVRGCWIFLLGNPRAEPEIVRLV